MASFESLHRVIFEELERQGTFGIDAVRLAGVLFERFSLEERWLSAHPENPRCVNGACDG